MDGSSFDRAKKTWGAHDRRVERVARQLREHRGTRPLSLKKAAVERAQKSSSPPEWLPSSVSATAATALSGTVNSSSLRSSSGTLWNR